MDAAREGEAHEASCNAPNLGLQLDGGTSQMELGRLRAPDLAHVGTATDLLAQSTERRVRGLRHQSTWTNGGVAALPGAYALVGERRATPSRVVSSMRAAGKRHRIWLSQRTAGDGVQGV